MGVENAAAGDGEAFRGEGFKAHIVDAGGDRGFDARRKQLLEQLEELVLQRNR